MSGWQPQQYDSEAHARRIDAPQRQEAPWPQQYPSQPRQPNEPRRQRPRRPVGVIAAVAAVVVLAAAAGAIYLTRSHAAPAPKALTCAQQYANWKSGADADGKQLEASLSAVSAAAKSEDIPVMDSNLKTMGADAAALEAYPMPACADPAGDWAQALADMKAAGDNASSATGLSALLLAEAPLKNVPALETKLDAELAKTAGVKTS